MSPADKDFVKQCLDGQPEAFRHLVRRHHGALVSYLTGRLGDGLEAEEAAQEAFVRAYFALKRLRKPASFFSWLMGIADRVVREQRRSRWREHRIAVAASERKPEATNAPDLPLKQAVAELPEVYREIVLLRYYGQMSCAEAAEQLGVPIGTVTKRLSRAYGLLRKSLQNPQGKLRGSEVQS